MTLAELLTACYQECNYAASPDAAVTTRLTRYLNEAVQAVMAEPTLARLLDSNAPFAFTSVAQQARYALPESISEVIAMRDTMNDRTLEWLDLQRYRRMDPDPTDRTGVPCYWVPLGLSPVAAQPSAPTELFLISTSGSDTQVATVEVVLADGSRRTLAITLTGVTAVSLGATLTTIVSVEELFLASSAVGSVTLREGSGTGAVLATIRTGQTRARHQSFYLYPTPSGAWTYAVDYRRTLTSMIAATDEPTLPTEFQALLIDYASSREWQHKDDTRASMAFERYTRWREKLSHRQHQTTDTVPIVGRGARTEYSRLGGWFPADRW